MGRSCVLPLVCCALWSSALGPSLPVAAQDDDDALAMDAPVRHAPDLTPARAFAADADAAAFGMLYRDSVRAQLGAALPLFGDGAHDGLGLELAPLVELHEPRHSTQPLPSQYWRARLPLELSWGWSTVSTRYRLGVVLEHESDHESSHAYSKAGFLALNDAALSLRAGYALGDYQLFAGARARLYVVSCTRARSRCQNFRGDSSAGAQLDLLLLGPSWGRSRLRPLLAASGFGILSNAGVAGESHAELHLGIALPMRWLDLQAFLLAYTGNDVGILRGLRVTELGVGMRLSLAQRP